MEIKCIQPSVNETEKENLQKITNTLADYKDLANRIGNDNLSQVLHGYLG